MGTSVESGTATAVVVTTGVNTYFGSMAGSIAEEPAPTSFDQGLNRFTWLMIRLMAVMVPLVFLINGFTKHDWKGAFFFAMAVAVGLTPEMLPMIVSVCLSKGALAMSRKKVIVKRLNAIQNFGGMDVLCTDKTGTLTEDRVVLQRHCDVSGSESRRRAPGRLPDQLLPDRPQEPARPRHPRQPDFKQEIDREVQEARRNPLRLHPPHDVRPGGGSRRQSRSCSPKALPKRYSITARTSNSTANCPRWTPTLIGGLERGIREPEQRRLPRPGRRHQGTPGKKICSKDDECDLVLKGYVAFLDPPKRQRRGRLSKPCTNTAWP